MTTLLVEQNIILLITIFISSYHSVQSFCDINTWNETDYRLASIIALTDLASAFYGTFSNCIVGLRHEFEPNMLQSTCLKHYTLRYNCVAAYLADDAECRYCLANSDRTQDLDQLNYGDILVNVTRVIGE